MLKTGLVSITFRKLKPLEIISLVKESGLAAIEWGGDVHVPHGNIAVARKVADQTRNAGLEVAAYGSYYRVGVSEDERSKFSSVLETAVELGASTIRVWAGNRGAADTSPELRKKIVVEALRISELAAQENIVIGFEYHGGTLTDSVESVRQLMDETNHDNLKFYWQPTIGMPAEQQFSGLRDVSGRLSNIHV